jgi:glycosyltransferase involved in cell wall biosynthesis
MRMAAPPRVSILIPVYNGAKYLGAAIQSVLDQSCPDFELLVLDNASTDATPAVIASFDDPRLRPFRNETNLGFLGNVEKGRLHSRGELLVDIGCDDIWERDMLARALAFWDSHPGLSFLHTGATWIDPDGRPIGRIDARWPSVMPGTQAFVEVFRHGFCFSGMFMRRSLLNDLGPIDRAWNEMLDLWWFLNLCLGGNMGYIHDPLVRFRLHPGSLSAALYVKGKGIRQHLVITASAFDWPKAQAAGLGEADRRQALRYLARDSLRQAHAVRNKGSRIDFLRTFAAVLRTVPEAAIYPQTWARLAAGLLPRSALAALRNRKYRRAAERLAVNLPTESGPEGRS